MTNKSPKMRLQIHLMSRLMIPDGCEDPLMAEVRAIKSGLTDHAKKAKIQLNFMISSVRNSNGADPDWADDQ